MIHNTTSATPRLDWLRSHLVLALQELQGWVDEWPALILGEVPAQRGRFCAAGQRVRNATRGGCPELLRRRRNAESPA